MAREPGFTAPDYIEPVVGWRAWDVVDDGAGLRLRSPAFRSLWLPGREFVAECARSEAQLAWAGIVRHTRAPDRACSCGVYAARTARQVTRYLRDLSRTPAPGLVCRVIGLVSLWGAIIEARVGWRAQRAYPKELWLPVRGRALPAANRLLWRAPRLPAEELVAQLGVYGVPVSIVKASTLRGLAAAVEERAASASA